MIWLNKLIKNIDNFYNSAIAFNKSAALSPELEAELALELSKKPSKEQGALKAQIKSFEEKHKETSNKAAIALQKLNSWDPTDNITAPFKTFMQAYKELLARINAVKPNLIEGQVDNSKVNKLNETNEQLNVLQDEEDIEKQQELDDLDNEQENIEHITLLATDKLPHLFEKICDFKYISEAKSIEDAEKELETLQKVDNLSEEEQKKFHQAEILAGKTMMWEEEFNAEEFLSAINDLLQDATTMAQIVVGEELELAEVAVDVATKTQVSQQTLPSGATELGVAFQQGQRLTRNRAEQNKKDMEAYRDKIKFAMRLFESSGDMTQAHFQSAVKRIISSQKYREKIKNDPRRRDHVQANVRKE
jgi:hypothetical protein